jgi:hypothetical protein
MGPEGGAGRPRSVPTDRIVEAYRRACLGRPGGYSPANHSYAREDVILQTYEILLLLRRAFRRVGWDAEALARCRLLEIGCAWGLRLGQLVGFNATPENLWGIDLQPSWVDLARARHPAMHFEVMSATEMTFDDRSFDASFAILALSAMLEPEIVDAALAEMCRVSRTCVVVIDNFRPAYSDSACGVTFFRGVDPSRVEQLASRADVRRVCRLGSFWTTSRSAWRTVGLLSRVGLGAIAYAAVVRLLGRHSHRGYLIELAPERQPT